MAMTDWLRGRARTMVATLALVAAAGTAAAQSVAEKFAAADWFERPVAQGVTWRFHHFDDLFSARQSVSVLEVDLSTPGLQIRFPYRAVNNSLQRTSSMVPTQYPSAVAGVNGTYFNTTTPFGGNTFLRVNGTTIDPETRAAANWGIQSGMGVSGDATVSMVMRRPSGGWASEPNNPQLMVCGPTLIEAGVIPSATFTAIGAHCTDRHPRTAVGKTADNRLILLTTDGRTSMAAGTTCQETALIMEALGCVDVVNLDGGGSTTMWVGGEPSNGVVNYPSDNGQYDHAGERACANAIAIMAPPLTTTLARDGRVTGVTYGANMNENTTQSATVTLTNLGTETWTADKVTLQTSRPTARTSPFRHASWIGAAQPVAMSPATVPPGGTATFRFTLQAPDVTTLTTYTETFALFWEGVRFGPADNEVRMTINVAPPAEAVRELFIESREPGHNFQWWAGPNWGTSSTNCTAPGLVGSGGQMYSATRRAIVGVRTCTFTPNLAVRGRYEVYVAWGAGGLRQPDITYIVHHEGGTYEQMVNQAATANVWVKLGGDFILPAGQGGARIQVSNKDTVDPTAAGNMFAGGVKLVLVENLEVASQPAGWLVVGE